MASNLNTVLYEYPVNQVYEPIAYNNTIQETKPVIIPVSEPVKPAKTAVKRNYSKFTTVLIFASFTLLATEAIIYFHSVQVGINANKLQNTIVQAKEQNYIFNVELAKTKELSKVENIAINELKMKPSSNSEISYLKLPALVTDKEYLITSVLPEPKKINILTGY